MIENCMRLAAPSSLTANFLWLICNYIYIYVYRYYGENVKGDLIHVIYKYHFEQLKNHSWLVFLHMPVLIHLNQITFNDHTRTKI